MRLHHKSWREMEKKNDHGWSVKAKILGLSALWRQLQHPIICILNAHVAKGVLHADLRCLAMLQCAAMWQVPKLPALCWRQHLKANVWSHSTSLFRCINNNMRQAKRSRSLNGCEWLEDTLNNLKRLSWDNWFNWNGIERMVDHWSRWEIKENLY